MTENSLELFQEADQAFDAGQLTESMNYCKKLLAHDEQHARGHLLKGLIFFQQRQFAHATEEMDLGMRLDASLKTSFTLTTLGTAHIQNKHPELALPFLQEAMNFPPRSLQKIIHLGLTYLDLNRFDEALALFQEGLQISPQEPALLTNLALTLHRQGAYQQALIYYNRALGFAPLHPKLRYNKALLHLLMRQYAKGWADYEYRLQITPYIFKRGYQQPLWDGQTFKDKTLFLIAEQGFGDTLQFCRFIPRIAALGGKVIFEVHPQLTQLFAPLSPWAEIIPPPEKPAEPPFDFDLYFPLMSLGKYWNLDMTQPTANDAYCFNPPAKLLSINNKGLKIGIVWAGSTQKTSLWPHFLKLIESTQHNYISLQLDAAAKDIPQTAPKNLTDVSKQIQNFEDTASIMNQLDLIISVDTAAAHLAGAMGKNVWIILPAVPDWRWLQDREDCPWYPTATLIRQKQLNDWDSVFHDIKHRLQKLS